MSTVCHKITPAMEKFHEEFAKEVQQTISQMNASGNMDPTVTYYMMNRIRTTYISTNFHVHLQPTGISVEDCVEIVFKIFSVYGYDCYHGGWHAVNAICKIYPEYKMAFSIDDFIGMYDIYRELSLVNVRETRKNVSIFDEMTIASGFEPYFRAGIHQ